MRSLAAIAITVALLALSTGCGPSSTELGRAYIQPDDEGEVGTTVRWEVTYRIGHDTAPGAQVRVLFPHSYYNNRPPNMLPQIDDPLAPGYCRLEINDQPAVLNLSSTALYPRHLIATAPREGWRRGDKLRFLIGLSAGGKHTFQLPHASGNRFAPFLLTDLDANGRFVLAPSQGGVNVRPGPAAQARVFAPGSVAVGETFSLTVAFFDRHGNPTDAAPVIEAPLTGHPAAPSGPSRLVTSPRGGAVATKGFSFAAPGVYRVTIELGVPCGAVTSNPVLVEAKPTQRLLWGDPHGHSLASDGARSPREFYTTARDVSRLDFAALTDHEWQVDTSEWAETQILCRSFTGPGFTPLLAWEYSLGGHGIVYYPTCTGNPSIGDGGVRELWQVALGGGRPASWQRLSGAYRLDAGYKPALWDHVRLADAFYVPHTSATVDMGDEADLDAPDITPLIEVYSGHGSNFSADDADHVPNFAPSGSVLQLLKDGREFGLIASSDSHDSRPGVATWGHAPPGLTGVWAASGARADLVTALRAGRTFATTGNRSIVRFAADDQPPGSRVVGDEPVRLSWRVYADGRLERLELWRNGAIWRRIPVAGLADAAGEITDDTRYGAAWYLLIAHLDGGGRAWSSPIFVDDPRTLILERFVTEDAAGINEIAVRGVPGRDTLAVTLFRRHGDDGGPRRVGYDRVASLDMNLRQIHYREPFSLAPGLTTYYLLREDTARGVRWHGPRALARFPEAEFDEGRFRFFVWRHGGPATVEIRGIEGETVRRIFLDAKQKGLVEVTWDTHNDAGKPVPDLTFYRLVEGDNATRWRPLARPTDETRR